MGAAGFEPAISRGGEEGSPTELRALERRWYPPGRHDPRASARTDNTSAPPMVRRIVSLAGSVAAICAQSQTTNAPSSTTAAATKADDEGFSTAISPRS